MRELTRLRRRASAALLALDGDPLFWLLLGLLVAAYRAGWLRLL